MLQSFFYNFSLSQNKLERFNENKHYQRSIVCAGKLIRYPSGLCYGAPLWVSSKPKTTLKFFAIVKHSSLFSITWGQQRWWARTLDLGT